jgi:hypothetical protein
MKRSVSLPSPPAAYARPEQKPAAAHKPAHSAHPLEVGSQPTERGVLSYPTLVSGLIHRVLSLSMVTVVYWLHLQLQSLKQI